MIIKLEKLKDDELSKKRVYLYYVSVVISDIIK